MKVRHCTVKELTFSMFFCLVTVQESWLHRMSPWHDGLVQSHYMLASFLYSIFSRTCFRKSDGTDDAISVWVALTFLSRPLSRQLIFYLLFSPDLSLCTTQFSQLHTSFFPRLTFTPNPSIIYLPVLLTAAKIPMIQFF